MAALLSQAAEVEEIETALQRALCGRVNESKLLSVAIFELIECHRPAFNVIMGEVGEGTSSCTTVSIECSMCILLAAVLALEAYVFSSGEEYAGLLDEIERKATGDSRPCYVLPVSQQQAPEVRAFAHLCSFCIRSRYSQRTFFRLPWHIKTVSRSPCAVRVIRLPDL